MKLLSIWLILLAIAGCTALPQNSNQPNQIQTCSDRAKQPLERRNVKEIMLTETKIVQSGTASQDKSIAYMFEAKAGQKLNYDMDQNVCVWVYTPDNQLIDNLILPKEGKYIIQLATLQGSRTFKISMSLDPVPVADKHPLVSPSPLKSPSLAPYQLNNPVVNESRPSPEQAVRDYYSDINNRNYQDAWNKLPAGLRASKKLHPEGYVSYVNWFETVNQIEIQNVWLANSNPDSATVNIRFKYHMKAGNVASEYLRFSLLWDATNNRWQFDQIKLGNS